MVEKFLLTSLVLALPLAVYIQCFTESEFVFNPLIDTELPQGFTQAKFNSIKPGMTKIHVLQLIPAPENGPKGNHWSYGNDGAALWGDYAWFQFNIHFNQDDKVTQATQTKFHD
ncbi:MAG: hypothetical protein HC866_19180 [Leptolyngbyaceae cyanobacterium RU_5_1]|nr:hypothetical protein [Leptolyngbyaceae cyanobacterium RU_5_1]